MFWGNGLPFQSLLGWVGYVLETISWNRYKLTSESAFYPGILSVNVWSPHKTVLEVFGCKASSDLQTCGHSSLLQGCQGSSLMMIVSPPRPEAANEFYDGDHDNDKESDVEI